MSFSASGLFYSLNSAASGLTGATVDVSGFDVDTPPVMQLIISGTATVLIEQSLNQTNWSLMKTVSSSDSYVLPVQGLYYRARISSYGSGTISAIVGPGAAYGALASSAGPQVRSQGPQ